MGHLVVSYDFIVMDMDEDPYTPLILGRAALKTLNAVVNCKNDTISVEVGNERIVFQFSKCMKKPMMKQVYHMQVVDRELEEMCGTRRRDDALMEVLNDDPLSFFDDAKQLKVILVSYILFYFLPL